MLSVTQLGYIVLLTSVAFPNRYLQETPVLASSLKLLGIVILSFPVLGIGNSIFSLKKKVVFVFINLENGGSYAPSSIFITPEVAVSTNIVLVSFTESIKFPFAF